MAINIFNLKKWWKMATGKSVLHVVQGAGQCYSPDKISGYYNDLTGKVLIQPELLNSGELPMVVAENGSRIIFPVAVFQYGLGAYDLYLTTGDNRYLKKFEQCYLWALEHIDSEGRWDNFFYRYFFFNTSTFNCCCSVNHFIKFFTCSIRFKVLNKL